MVADSIVRSLGARRVGSSWMAKCPAHNDRNPSLAIRESDGKILLRCHAGCSQHDVIDAMKALGLWELERTEPSRIVATYDYTDEHGALLYQVVRYEPKGFKQRRPDGYGGWIWKKHPRQVLYHLPEVLEAPIVFVVEGERDVETLREYGFVATTNAGGAKAPWLDCYTTALAGREVIVIPDNDAPGKARGAQIARALIGKAARLLAGELDGAKDISEWFEHRHSELELITLIDSEALRA